MIFFHFDLLTLIEVGGGGWGGGLTMVLQYTQAHTLTSSNTLVRQLRGVTLSVIWCCYQNSEIFSVNETLLSDPVS